MNNYVFLISIIVCAFGFAMLWVILDVFFDAIYIALDHLGFFSWVFKIMGWE